MNTRENNIDYLITALLDELSKLNGHITLNSNMETLIKHSGIFLYGFNPAGKVEPESYKRYVSFITAITEVLEDYDICIKNNGYTYIVDSVMLIIDQNRLDIKLQNDIYPYIRRKYNLNDTHIVEHNIRNAIKSSYKRCKSGDKTNRMITYGKRPTNKEFLLQVTHEVCSKMCTELLSSNC